MKKWLFVVFGVTIISSGVLYVWLGNEMDRGVEKKASGENEYAIILGAKVNPGGVPSLSLANRLQVATDYLHKYPHVIAVVSGGQGADEDRTEASVMKDYLLAEGIAPERILVEDEATSTYENLLYSKRLLPEDVTKITIISNDFHLKRASYLAEKIGFQPDIVAAPTPKIVEAKMRLRERLALLKTYVVGQ
ncbi:YdcF family protein [Solibacillus sp. FSL K6-1523]|uniref:YdcF family protein n=1 Tax=Solibacillus sp. FSL K6-1523 TaxID=2921471 RepID=UPI0030F9DE87